ncbi:GPH family glycoside/pentoside/hexuronide:cation symporter [Streptacidiphilus sp. MAP12-16]|uniref:MFS transporter n=1 Tax=Streptacidiphilus sp. MAP12-16 TaxID=3156300 RepID=UPI0035164A29
MTIHQTITVPTVTPLSRTTRWGYGGGEWANAVMWTAFTSLFLYFTTDIVGMGPALGGTATLIGTLWNAVLQPYVGSRSDRLRSPHGKRHPFLLAAVLPYALTSWLLFTDFGLTGTARAAYFIAVVLAWSTSLTVFYVPYGALGTELSTDYEERTTLATIRTLFSQLGALLGAAGPLVLAGLLAGPMGGERAGWSAAAAICGAAASAGILLTWATTRGHHPTAQATEPDTESAAAYLSLLKSPTVRRLVGLLTFGWAPLSVTGAVAVYYATHIMGYSQSTASLTMLAWFVSGLAWLPLVQHLSHRIGKTHTYLLFTITWAVIQSLFLLPDRGDPLLFWALIVTSSAGSTAVAVTGWSLLADVTDVEELRTGRRCEGTLYGLAAFAQTATAALVVWLAALALTAAGYSDTHTTTTALNTIRFLSSIGTAVWLLPGILCCLRLRLTRDRHHAIRLALDARTTPSPLAHDAEADLLRGL